MVNELKHYRSIIQNFKRGLRILITFGFKNTVNKGFTNEVNWDTWDLIKSHREARCRALGQVLQMQSLQETSIFRVKLHD